MRTPEEVAREIRRLTWDVLGNDGLVEEDGPALADLIRARDAEVAAAQRDVTLVSFEWETTPGPIGTWNAPARRLVGPWEPVEP